ncbi:unnamed protein product [Clavelina lepadiformis]|uniref:Uncharacterized protein n=1 Tax=Clavelina lepadiformis TaxID=159417 RepID=A0ABP0GTL3_CLALP
MSYGYGRSGHSPVHPLFGGHAAKKSSVSALPALNLDPSVPLSAKQIPAPEKPDYDRFHGPQGPMYNVHMVRDAYGQPREVVYPVDYYDDDVDPRYMEMAPGYQMMSPMAQFDPALAMNTPMDMNYPGYGQEEFVMQEKVDPEMEGEVPMDSEIVYTDLEDDSDLFFVDEKPEKKGPKTDAEHQGGIMEWLSKPSSKPYISKERQEYEARMAAREEAGSSSSSFENLSEEDFDKAFPADISQTPTLIPKWKRKRMEREKKKLEAKSEPANPVETLTSKLSEDEGEIKKDNVEIPQSDAVKIAPAHSVINLAKEDLAAAAATETNESPHSFMAAVKGSLEYQPEEEFEESFKAVKNQRKTNTNMYKYGNGFPSSKASLGKPGSSLAKLGPLMPIQPSMSQAPYLKQKKNGKVSIHNASRNAQSSAIQAAKQELAAAAMAESMSQPYLVEYDPRYMAFENSYPDDFRAGYFPPQQASSLAKLGPLMPIPPSAGKYGREKKKGKEPMSILDAARAAQATSVISLAKGELAAVEAAKEMGFKNVPYGSVAMDYQPEYENVAMDYQPEFDPYGSNYDNAFLRNSYLPEKSGSSLSKLGSLVPIPPSAKRSSYSVGKMKGKEEISLLDAAKNAQATSVIKLAKEELAATETLREMEKYHAQCGIRAQGIDSAMPPYSPSMEKAANSELPSSSTRQQSDDKSGKKLPPLKPPPQCFLQRAPDGTIIPPPKRLEPREPLFMNDQIPFVEDFGFDPIKISPKPSDIKAPHPPYMGGLPIGKRPFGYHLKNPRLPPLNIPESLKVDEPSITMSMVPPYQARPLSPPFSLEKDDFFKDFKEPLSGFKDDKKEDQEDPSCTQEQQMRSSPELSKTELMSKEKENLNSFSSSKPKNELDASDKELETNSFSRRENKNKSSSASHPGPSKVDQQDAVYCKQLIQGFEEAMEQKMLKLQTLMEQSEKKIEKQSAQNSKTWTEKFVEFQKSLEGLKLTSKKQLDSMYKDWYKENGYGSHGKSMDEDEIDSSIDKVKDNKSGPGEEKSLDGIKPEADDLKLSLKQDEEPEEKKELQNEAKITYEEWCKRKQDWQEEYNRMGYDVMGQKFLDEYWKDFHKKYGDFPKEENKEMSESTELNSWDLPTPPGENPDADDTDNDIEDIFAFDAKSEKEENKKKSEDSKVNSWDLPTPPVENRVANDTDNDIEDILASDAKSKKEENKKKSEDSKVNSCDLSTPTAENPVANDIDTDIEDILASDAKSKKEENKKKSEDSKVNSCDLSTPTAENQVANDIDTDIEDILASDAKSEKETDKSFVSIPTEKIRKETVYQGHTIVAYVKKPGTGIHRPEPECELSGLSLSDGIERKTDKIEKEELEGQKEEQKQEEKAEIAVEEEKELEGQNKELEEEKKPAETEKASELLGKVKTEEVSLDNTNLSEEDKMKNNDQTVGEEKIEKEQTSTTAPETKLAEQKAECSYTSPAMKHFITQGNGDNSAPKTQEESIVIRRQKRAPWWKKVKVEFRSVFMLQQEEDEMESVTLAELTKRQEIKHKKKMDKIHGKEELRQAKRKEKEQKKLRKSEKKEEKARNKEKKKDKKMKKREARLKRDVAEQQMYKFYTDSLQRAKRLRKESKRAGKRKAKREKKERKARDKTKKAVEKVQKKVDAIKHKQEKKENRKKNEEDKYRRKLEKAGYNEEKVKEKMALKEEEMKEKLERKQRELELKDNENTKKIKRAWFKLGKKYEKKHIDLEEKKKKIAEKHAKKEKNWALNLENRRGKNAMTELEKKGKRITKLIKKERKDAKKEMTIWKKAEKKKLKEESKEIKKEDKVKNKKQKKVKKRQEWALKIEKDYDSTSLEDFEENMTKLELDGKMEKTANSNDEDVEQKGDACMSMEARMKKSYGILKKERKQIWLTKRAQEKKRMQKTHEVVASNEKQSKQKSEDSKVNSCDLPTPPVENQVTNDTDNVIEDILASDAKSEKEENKKKSEDSKVNSCDLPTPPVENPVENDIDTDMEDISASDAKSEKETDKSFVSIPTVKIRKETVSGSHKFVPNTKKSRAGIHRPEPEWKRKNIEQSTQTAAEEEKELECGDAEAKKASKLLEKETTEVVSLDDTNLSEEEKVKNNDQTVGERKSKKQKTSLTVPKIRLAEQKPECSYTSPMMNHFFTQGYGDNNASKTNEEIVVIQRPNRKPLLEKVKVELRPVIILQQEEDEMESSTLVEPSKAEKLKNKKKMARIGRKEKLRESSPQDFKENVSELESSDTCMTVGEHMKNNYEDLKKKRRQVLPARGVHKKKMLPTELSVQNERLGNNISNEQSFETMSDSESPQLCSNAEICKPSRASYTAEWLQKHHLTSKGTTSAVRETQEQHMSFNKFMALLGNLTDKIDYLIKEIKKNSEKHTPDLTNFHDCNEKLEEIIEKANKKVYMHAFNNMMKYNYNQKYFLELLQSVKENAMKYAYGKFYGGYVYKSEDNKGLFEKRVKQSYISFERSSNDFAFGIPTPTKTSYTSYPYMEQNACKKPMSLLSFDSDSTESKKSGTNQSWTRELRNCLCCTSC